MALHAADNQFSRLRFCSAIRDWSYIGAELRAIPKCNLNEKISSDTLNGTWLIVEAH
jgi:hypothetical protein